MGVKKMKKLLYMISLVSLLVILNCQLCLAQKVSGPNILLEERLYDAKDVIESAVITHEFKVSNTGDSPLEISRISTG
jgi:hypothetical protein